jgi:methionyl-tRNA formyltransferase
MVASPSLRVVFFGTPSFALPTLNALLASRHQVVGVVTQPDRPRGRGQRTSDAPVKARAREAGLPMLQPAVLKDQGFLDALSAFRSDIGVVAAYGRILPEATLKTPRLGMVNVHASLLPRYRGAAPVHRAVMAGEQETGVTIIRLVKAMDAGPMLAAERRSIGRDETSADVEQALADVGATLLVRTVDDLASGTATEVAQDESGVTYAPQLTKDEGAVDWSRGAVEIHNLIRGLHPWPHAFSFIRGNRLVLLRSAVLDQASDAPPGVVVSAQKDDLHVATSRGVLALREVQPDGRRPMAVRDFLAGHRIDAGEHFSSR